MAGSLICNHISKKYSDGTVALNDVNINIPTKGIFSLIGRNGAGKTTLVRILATNLCQTSGTARINGIDTLKEPKKLRDMIAIVPQEARMIMWTTPKQMVMSYLLYRGHGYKESKAMAEAALREVGLSKYANILSNRLSGGTKRKVLVAMVIASDAQIIFLDEPTTGLDPISRTELWHTLNKLKRKRFIFLTTHYLEESERLADHIGVLESGKLVAVGTLEELRGMAKNEYSLRILQKGVKIRPREGETVTGFDGHKQILTTEAEANRLSRELIRKGIRFSSNPVSLEDIFYYLVKKPIEVDSEGEKNGHYKE